MKKLNTRTSLIISIILNIIVFFLLEFWLAKALICVALLVNIFALIKEVQNDRK